MGITQVRYFTGPKLIMLLSHYFFSLFLYLSLWCCGKKFNSWIVSWIKEDNNSIYLSKLFQICIFRNPAFIFNDNILKRRFFYWSISKPPQKVFVILFWTSGIIIKGPDSWKWKMPPFCILNNDFCDCFLRLIRNIKSIFFPI